MASISTGFHLVAISTGLFPLATTRTGSITIGFNNFWLSPHWLLLLLLDLSLLATTGTGCSVLAIFNLQLLLALSLFALFPSIWLYSHWLLLLQALLLFSAPNSIVLSFHLLLVLWLW